MGRHNVIQDLELFQKNHIQYFNLNIVGSRLDKKDRCLFRWEEFVEVYLLDTSAGYYPMTITFRDQWHMSTSIYNDGKILVTQMDFYAPDKRFGRVIKCALQFCRRYELVKYEEALKKIVIQNDERLIVLYPVSIEGRDVFKWTQHFKCFIDWRFFNDRSKDNEYRKRS